MKTILILTILLGTLLFSCNNSKPVKINFEGKAFELPIKVSEAKQKFGLFYGYYYGFYLGNQNQPTISTQLEDFPLFMGTDNDPEEHFKDNYFVGITFYKTGETLKKYKNILEKKYGEKFVTINLNRKTKNKNLHLKNIFHYLKTKNGLSIALKETIRKPNNIKCVSISFYSGIPEDELEKYLKYIK